MIKAVVCTKGFVVIVLCFLFTTLAAADMQTIKMEQRPTGDLLMKLFFYKNNEELGYQVISITNNQVVSANFNFKKILQGKYSFYFKEDNADKRMDYYIENGRPVRFQKYVKGILFSEGSTIGFIPNNGEIIYYGLDKRPLRKEKYIKGQLVTSSEYTKEGKILRTEVYRNYQVVANIEYDANGKKTRIRQMMLSDQGEITGSKAIVFNDKGVTQSVTAFNVDNKFQGSSYSYNYDNLNLVGYDVVVYDQGVVTDRFKYINGKKSVHEEITTINRLITEYNLLTGSVLNRKEWNFKTKTLKEYTVLGAISRHPFSLESTPNRYIKYIFSLPTANQKEPVLKDVVDTDLVGGELIVKKYADTGIIKSILKTKHKKVVSFTEYDTMGVTINRTGIILEQVVSRNEKSR